jgi:hypothetical protein
MGCTASAPFVPQPEDPEVLRREAAIEETLRAYELQLQPLRAQMHVSKENYTQELAVATDRQNIGRRLPANVKSSRSNVNTAKSAVANVEQRYNFLLQQMRDEVADLRAELRDYIEKRERGDFLPVPEVERRAPSATASSVDTSLSSI